MTQEKLEALGYTISSVLVRDSYNGIEGDHEHEVTIGLGNNSIKVPYTSGCAHRHFPGRPLVGPKGRHFSRLTVHDVEQNKKTVPNEPTLADVLYSLLLDSGVGRNALSFGEFCDEYGYDEDSREAYRIFTACQEMYTKLRRLGADLEALDEILEDY